MHFFKLLYFAGCSTSAWLCVELPAWSCSISCSLYSWWEWSYVARCYSSPPRTSVHQYAAQHYAE